MVRGINFRVRLSRLFILHIVVLCSNLSVAGEKNSSPEKKEFQHWAAFPAIAYNAETGLLLGGLLVHFIEPVNPNDRTSTIDLLLTTTSKQQYSLMLSPNFYLKNNSYHIEAFAEVKYWPANYYGIGSDSPDEPAKYEATDREIRLAMERKFFDSIYVGGIYHYKDESHVLEASPLFDAGVTGADGGVQSGLGLIFSYDSRDKVNDARKGLYFKYTGIEYGSSLNSDYRYTSQELKLYKYLTLHGKAGLALGGYLRSSRGEVPFRSLSTPDGIRILRGIERGRYRDRDLLALQAAYRFPLAARWGAVVFADTTQLANTLADLSSQEWKSSIGAGLRWALNPVERLNVRLDVSYVENQPGLVLEIRDAF